MNKTLKAGILVILMILLSSTVLAIGISPGRSIVDFEPNLEKNISFTIINTEHKFMKIILRKEGELADYIELNQILIDFTPEQDTRKFSYVVKLPVRIEQPGDHGASVVAMELPSEGDLKPGVFITSSGAGAYIGAVPAVATQLLVKVPYPGKYAEARLEVSDSQVNETVMFNIPVLNFGTENLDKVKAEIEILGPTNEIVARLESDEQSIEPKMRKELVAYWKANVNPGFYHAVVMVDYDGKKARVDKTFNIGSLNIDVIDIRVSNFQLGGVAKFEIDVVSNWNEKLKDVYAQLFIYDKNNNEIVNFKSVSIDLEAKGKGTLEAFWDTAGMEAGKYPARLVLYYGGRSLEKTIETDVSLTGIKTSLTTGRAINPREESFIRQNSVLIIAIIVLIIINIGWFIYTRRRK